MEDIIAYYIDIFHLDKHVEPPVNVVNKLNALDRVGRAELKSRLFTEAKKLGVGGDGLRAIRWLESTFEQIERYSFRLHDVLFSPGQDIPENIAFYMSQATKSVDLCVFTISDEKLSACLKALHRRGVAVRLITDGNKMRDHGSQVKELARCGISVKVDNSRYHMHNKFGIIDGRIVFTGSYNWTYTAQAYNQENLLLTTNFTIVHKFADEFERLWQQMFWLKVKQLKDGQLRANVNVNGRSMEVSFAQPDGVGANDADCLLDDETTAEGAQSKHRKPRPERDDRRKSGKWQCDDGRQHEEGSKKKKKPKSPFEPRFAGRGEGGRKQGRRR